MEEYKFCPMCASKLEVSFVEGRQRLACASCSWVNYKNPLPVIACLVVNPQKELLLIKRGVEPCRGSWALPGGFVEIDENPEEAGKRELKEETGITGRPGRQIGVNQHISSKYGAILMVGIEYLTENFNLKVGDDAEDARFFTHEDLPEIPFESHRVLIDKFLMLDKVRE